MLSQIADFVNWLRRRNPQARTWRDYSYDLKQFAAVVGDPPPAEVTFRDIDRFVNSQVACGYKPATVNRRLAAILALFTYLADEDPALVCPVIPRRHFLREPQRLPRPVKEDDLRLFFAVIEAARSPASRSCWGTRSLIPPWCMPALTTRPWKRITTPQWDVSSGD